MRINPHLIAFFLAKLLICFAIRGLFRRHNLLVVGSNPTGPTSILNAICHSSAPKGGLLFISERRVRRVCGCGPEGWRIQSINPWKKSWGGLEMDVYAVLVEST